ncbi:MAG TPA: pseudouridine synthase, partial [Candidatus Babeliales bacterium]|nr:pseudouridine synthase [Candidatus Babeliales bacterium]
MTMPLNKFLAHSGVCSRRQAVEIIKRGGVTVNGTVIKEPGHKIEPTDAVKCEGKLLKQESSFEYVLLNKPKGYVTTLSDEKKRPTVIDLVQGASKKRIYPIGRLDINTTGLLLLTNDGQFAQHLSHPSFSMKKVYQLTLNRPLDVKDFERIKRGISLDDGRVDVGAIVVSKANPKAVSVTLESGRNRIVRRIFEHFGYTVKKLDRVGYVGLSTKGMPVGSWRYLNEKEIKRLAAKKLLPKKPQEKRPKAKRSSSKWAPLRRSSAKGSLAKRPSARSSEERPSTKRPAAK